MVLCTRTLPDLFELNTHQHVFTSSAQTSYSFLVLRNRRTGCAYKLSFAIMVPYQRCTSTIQMPTLLYLDAHKSVHRDTTMKITNKMHYEVC
jgi:hypothetical protein